MFVENLNLVVNNILMLNLFKILVSYNGLLNMNIIPISQRDDSIFSRRDELLKKISSMSGAEITAMVVTNANRYATMSRSEGSVRYQEGLFMLPEEIEIIRNKLSTNANKVI